MAGRAGSARDGPRCAAAVCAVAGGFCPSPGSGHRICSAAARRVLTMRDTDNLGPDASRETSEGVWPYVGIGCLSAVAGLAGGGMIAVLVAKIVGGIGGCRGDEGAVGPRARKMEWDA